MFAARVGECARKNRVLFTVVARNLSLPRDPSYVFSYQRAGPASKPGCFGLQTVACKHLHGQRFGLMNASASNHRFSSTDANEEAKMYGIVSQSSADLQEVLDLLNDKKAENISVLDSNILKAMKPLCKYMVILSCSSRRHMKVVADYVSDHFKLKGMLLEFENEEGDVVHQAPKIESADSDSWMLIDLGNIIVQVFSREGRDTYRLEEHWADVEAAREAGLTYQGFINCKGAAAAAVASKILEGNTSASRMDAATSKEGGTSSGQ